MRFNEIMEYFKVNFDIPALWKSIRTKIGERIKTDETFLDEYYDLLQHFRSEDKMLEKMTLDAFNADIEEKEELELFPNEWLSWIVRL